VAQTNPEVPSPHPFASLSRWYVKVQLLINPLLSAVAALALAPTEHVRAFLLSLTVAVVASSVAFGAAALLLLWDLRRSGRGAAPPRHAAVRYLVLALLGMPLGLVLAAHTTELLFQVRVPSDAFDYRLGVVLGTLLALVFYSWQSANDARRAALSAQLERERAERHELEAKLSALTAQLNPHVLFNALNTVAALIPEHPERAEGTLLRLADLYRGLLAATRRQEHTLEDELEICRAYLDVERARFSDRLAVELDVAPGLGSSRLPVLLLQPLVENAVSHGLGSRSGKGTVCVAARSTAHGLELRVADDGVGLGSSVRRGTGVGLDNTRQRLQLRYGARADLTLSARAGGGTEAVLRLPAEPPGDPSLAAGAAA
jgi:sensor histidine kinase YesM